MLKFSVPFAISLILATLFLTDASLQAQDQATSPAVPITTVVTVLGPKFTAPPPVAKDDVIVFEGKDRRKVTGWVQAQGEKGGLQFAILIDNSVSTTLGNQFGDLKNFIIAQPKNTAVGIFYAANGTVQIASKFDTNHEAVAKTLHLPLGALGGNSPSIYLSLGDLDQASLDGNARSATGNPRNQQRCRSIKSRCAGSLLRFDPRSSAASRCCGAHNLRRRHSIRG